MISYEEFEKFCACSVDEVPDNHKVQVLAIFSSGYVDEYDKDFERLHPDVAKSLTLHKLYDYVKTLFASN